MHRFLLGFAALASAVPLQAAWYRASSRHFLIYSEQKPDTLRRFAESLEKFDGAVRQVRGMSDLPPSEGNRVTIFSLPDSEEVQRLSGDKSGFIRGFYKGSAAGSVAFVSRGNSEVVNYVPTGTRRSSRVEYGLADNTLLFHEYAHHLMMQDLTSPVPQWIIEGFAEFMSTAKFENNGSVGLGLPATHRYSGLLTDAQLSVQQLVAADYRPKTNVELESLYGRGWLLTHYLTFEPSRKGQLNTYVKLMSQSVPPLKAAEQAFGDLKELDEEVTRYLHRSTLRYVTIDKEAVPTGPIDITKLSDGAESVIPLLIEVRNGVEQGDAEKLAAKAREAQSRFPNEPLVLTTLAELELAAKRPKAAEEAALRVLSSQPKNLDAAVLHGRALAAQAEAAQGDERHALFERARKAFISANAIDKEDPEPLMEYYLTFPKEGVAPNANAISALHYASELAPQDAGLRMNSAIRYLIDGKLVDAKRSLVPIAFDPHGGGYVDYARRVYTAVNAGDRERALELAQQEPASTD